MGSEEEEESVVSAEQAAAERRERLRAFKAYAAENNSVQAAENNSVQAQDDDNGTDENQENNLNMKFRNYLPHDKHLQEGKLAPPVLPKFEDPIATEPPMQEKQEDPFLNIAPKKPNWDLRRDVQKKLDKLEKRTQKAIFQLMEDQERQKILLEGENGADGMEEYNGNS